MLTSIATTQALASGAVSWTPSVKDFGGSEFYPKYLTLHASASMVSEQTLTVTLDDVDGSGHDTLLYSEPIPGGDVDKLYTFPDGLRQDGVEKDSRIKVTLTNTGTPTSTAALKLFYKT